MAGFTNNMANLASAKLTAGLSASANTVNIDDATPYAGLGDFYATLMPSSEMARLSNSEIVLCSYASATSLTITRGQRGTTARSFNSGDVIANGIYVQDLAQVQAVGNTIFNTTYSNGVYSIISDNDMLPGIPTNGMRITIKVNSDSTGTPKLDIQGLGAEYDINTGTVINGSTTHNAASLKSGQIYELTFNGTSWETKNIFSGSGTNGLIGTSDIANGVVSNSKIANGAVNVAKIENGAVSNAKIANDAITSNKINWATISSSGKIELGSICIQWGRTELSSLTWSDYWSSWRRTDAKTLTFPVAFSGAPYYTSVSTNANGTVFAQATQSGDADKLTFMLYKPNNVPPDPTTMKVSWIAIGPKS